MAYFGDSDSVCSDCGSDSALSTDLFGDTRDYCFDCYLENADGLRYAVLAPVGDSYVVGGARSDEDAREVERSIRDMPFDTDVAVLHLSQAYSTGFPTDYKGDEVLDGYYCRELARGVGSESRNVYTGAVDLGDRTAVIDFETYVSTETWRCIRDGLADLVEPCFDTRDELGDVVDGRLGNLPYVVRREVETVVWERARRDGDLSDGSRRALRNQEAGRVFEEFFSDWCDERGIDCYASPRTALRRLYPTVHDDLVSSLGPRLAGVPDFFVRSNPQETLADTSEWRPPSDAFVEVKYNESRMSDVQKRAAAHLKGHGFAVYVLRGTPDDFFFERR